jgi:predicted dehydrogenase
MKQKIRCAILGTGHGHAAGKLRVLQESDDWELVGVCEPDPAWRARREREAPFAGVRWLAEADALGDPSLKMVAVESEVRQLVGLGQKVIDAGKHLHLDKPAGVSLPAFRALLNAADRKGLIVQMGYMFRYNTGFDLIRRAVREGWLGHVHYLHGTINSLYDAAHRKTLDFHRGGMMFELAGHLIDMLVLLMGRPRRVTPFMRHDGAFDNQLADNTLAVLEYDRAVALIESSALEVGSSARRHFEVLGNAGSVVLQPLEPPALRLCLSEPRGGYQAGWQDVAVPNIPRYVRDLQELARCIRGEQAFPYSKEHDLTMHETLLRACGVEE